MNTILNDGNNPFQFKPVVIIGAARSGTNALRDALNRLDRFGTWPCDEINPIWRHGNLEYPNDEIPRECAVPKVRKYIRSRFRKIWAQQKHPDVVIEKTCANSLRVPFVDAVLPEASYIYIVRNGYDVIASARKRWMGEIEVPRLPYFLAKARYAPLSDLPHYALSALGSRIRVKRGRSKHLGSWGPRFDGIDDLDGSSIEELVIRQWVACVTASDAFFETIDDSRVFRLHYEKFTQNPSDTLAEILSWLGERASSKEISLATEPVRSSSVGKGAELANVLPENLRQLLRQPLAEHGYI